MTDTEEPIEDFLDVDQKIPGQNYCCLSFISPENVLKKKDMFMTSHFLTYLLGNELDDEDQERIRQSTLEELKKVVKSEGGLTYKATEDFYTNWLYTREDKLKDEFNESVDYQTATRGVKIRGTYDTLKEAQVRAKVMQRKDKNFSVFVGQVGYWLPWDPSPDSVQDQEYQEGQLNQLMGKYKENCEKREDFYEKDKEEKIKKAKEENRYKNQSETSDFDLNKPHDKEKIEKMRTITDTKLGYDVSNDRQSEVSKEFDSLTVEDPWLERQMSKDEKPTISNQKV